MKTWTCIMLIFMGFCLGCGEAGNQTDTETAKTGDTAVVDDSYISTTPIPLDGCYSMIAGQDTATMRLNVVDSLITGDLSYRLMAKDRNDGSIKGVIRDSMIIANYTFRSEGMLSVRQVAFKLSGTALVEGYGELDATRDTVRFKDVKALNFQYDRPFIKVNCIE
jgi:hypothetical protein